MTFRPAVDARAATKPNGTIVLEVILLKLIGGGIQQDQKVETDTSQLYTSWFHNVMSR